MSKSQLIAVADVDTRGLFLKTWINLKLNMYK